MESILNSIKKMLGISATVTSFDVDIKTHINSVLMSLTQIGVGPEGGFVVVNELDTWESFLGYTTTKPAAAYMTTGEVSPTVYMEAVKTYVYIKVKLVFDPPTSSSHLQALIEQAHEYEWRLNIQADK